MIQQGRLTVARFCFKLLLKTNYLNLGVDKYDQVCYTVKVFKIIALSSHACGSLLFDGSLPCDFLYILGTKIIFMEVPK